MLLVGRQLVGWRGKAVGFVRLWLGQSGLPVARLALVSHGLILLMFLGLEVLWVSVLLVLIEVLSII